jgi:hypothetical protein
MGSGLGLVMAGLAAALTLGGGGQDVGDDDWDFFAQPERQLTRAYVEYSGGQVFSVQCQAGTLMTAIGGLPEAALNVRQFTRHRADGQEEAVHWRRLQGQNILLSTSAARDARSLRGGGMFRMTGSAAAGQQPVEVSLELPSQSTNLDRVLTDCGYATSVPSDHALSVGTLMARPPVVQVPDWVLRRHDLVTVELDCIISGGRLSQCRAERVTPTDQDIGEGIANRANGVEVTTRDPVAAEGRVVLFKVEGRRREHTTATGPG